MATIKEINEAQINVNGMIIGRINKIIPTIKDPYVQDMLTRHRENLAQKNFKINPNWNRKEV